jgi:hypothetical protein
VVVLVRGVGSLVVVLVRVVGSLAVVLEKSEGGASEELFGEDRPAAPSTSL